MVYKIAGKIKIRNLKVKYDNFWIKTLKNTHSIINYTVNICKNKLFYFVLLIIFLEKSILKIIKFPLVQYFSLYLLKS